MSTSNTLIAILDRYESSMSIHYGFKAMTHEAYYSDRHKIFQHLMHSYQPLCVEIGFDIWMFIDYSYIKMTNGELYAISTKDGKIPLGIKWSRLVIRNDYTKWASLKFSIKKEPIALKSFMNRIHGDSQVDSRSDK